MRLPNATAAVCAGLATMLVANGARASTPSNDCRLELGPSRSVARIVDSETLLLDDGREVRLIGALGPRALDVGAEPGAWPPEEAAKVVLTQLVLSQSITLAFGGEQTDRYGRWLAHVFVGEGDAQRWVQGLMLQSGHARSYAISGNRACQSELLAHEKIARDAGLGLWTHAAYQSRKPWPARELSNFASTFQIVEGRVTRVTQGRDFIYLNFGREGRWDFSVAIRRSDRETIGHFGGDAKHLQGRRVEVRGWIEQRSGPLLDISIAGQIVARDSPTETMASDQSETLAEPRVRRSRPRTMATPVPMLESTPALPEPVRPSQPASPTNEGRPAPQGTGRSD